MEKESHRNRSEQAGIEGKRMIKYTAKDRANEQKEVINE